MTNAIQQLTLPDGRNLDYMIGGDEKGYPLVYIHGTPGALPQLSSLVRVCKDKKVKLISLSRSGYGGSSRNRGRSVVDDALDIQNLVDHLGIKECIVAGWSGGGPPSLACAARLKGCKASLVVAGVAPYGAEGLDWLEGQGEDNLKEFEATLKGEDHLAAFLMAQRQGLLKATPEAIIEEMSSILPEEDKRALMENKDLADFLCTSFSEALKNNCDGWIDDDLSMMKPSWGFNLDEIKVPVYLWQGDTDLMVPFGHGKWLGEHLPQDKITTHFEKGEGHISIFLKNIEKMIDELLQHV